VEPRHRHPDLGARDSCAAFEKPRPASEIPYEVVARRPGDVAVLRSRTRVQGRTPTWAGQATGLTLEQACADSFRWQSANPNGYATDED
jgi:UDP-glucose 4-epimerase